ncbi:redoxin domain-containing protein [Gracilibacillus marinus]|uniref:Redoxin domain-containing protein n=1 Tax=Gracilibacillus marinus TaxID=630535 RepID=A0ABV8VYV8_9BACI
MKRSILILVVFGMFGWAVIEFLNSDDESKEQAGEKVEKQEINTEIVQEESEEGIATGLEVGDMAPDFQLQTLSGEEARLSDYRGSRVMINFWATWCPPCRAEMPDMEKFYQDKDVVILAINLVDTENSLQNVKDFSEEYNLTFPILLDTDMEVSTLYAVRPLPTSYMIDSNGRINNIAFGALNYDLMIQEYERMD